MTVGKESRILASVIIVFILISFASAITGSIGNAKMVLYPKVNGWTTTTIEKSILVKNVNDEYISVKLEPDEAGKDFLEVVDSEFNLYPGEEKDAQFLVNVRKEGNYEGRINVFFTSLEGEGGPGVVLSSVILVKAEKDTGYQEGKDENGAGNEENNDTGVSVFTGGAVGVSGGNKKSRVPLILEISSLLLLGVLVGLIIMMNKSKSKTKRKKSGRKKTKRKKK